MFSLEVEKLKKSFGTHTVLKDISFKHPGGALGIAGPNGSGKTTLLRCLGGLLTPDGGSITWFRQQQELLKGDLQHIAGYAASYINLYRELSLMENLAFILRLRGEHFSAARARELLQVAGLGDQCDQSFGKLSTGQQQRARLTSALITDPFILLLDEPGSNLDEGGKAFVADTIASFCEKGKLVILASNNREELDLADRIYSVADLTFEH